MDKLLKEVKKVLKKQKKEKVLKIWNEYQSEWLGNTKRDKNFLTKKDFLKEWGLTGREVSYIAKSDRNMYGWDNKKKYVVLNEYGYPESVGKFYSKDFVNLDDEYFLSAVYEYREYFGLYGKF